MYTGPWIKMRKTPESSERQREGPIVTLMHDDAVTRELGFMGGFVGGPSLEGVMAAAIPASFGHTWYEGGVHSIRIFRPVYAEEEVRVAWDEIKPDPGDKRKVQYRLEKKNGERVAAGWAALGQSVEKLAAPWERDVSSAGETGDDVLPEIPIGAKYAPLEQTASREMVDDLLDRVQDTNWWYRIASPWGAPLIPPYFFGTMILRYTVESDKDRRMMDDTLPLWMYAGLDILVYRPAFIGQPYRFEGHVCQKGRTARSVYVVRECNISGADNTPVARARFRGTLLQLPQKV